MKTHYLALFILAFTWIGTLAKPVSTFTLVNPCAPLASITSIQNTYGCFSLTAGNGYPNDPDSYFQWNFGDGTSASGRTVYHCYSPSVTAVTYTIHLTYNNPVMCGGGLAEDYTITLNPPAQTTCIHPRSNITLAASTVTVWSGFVIPETMFSFTYGDGTPSTTTNIHTYTVCGNYIVEVKSWDMNMPSNVCYSYAAVNMVCSGPPTGIEKRQPENSPVTLFPNPAREAIHLSSGHHIRQMEITDVSGRKIRTAGMAEGSDYKVDVQNLPSGKYYLRMQFENGTEQVTPFIKGQ